MSNICDTQYKVRGSRKALSDLWNTLQMMEVNSKDVYLYKLAEHYSIDYEHSCISVRGHIYWAEFEDNKDGGLLSALFSEEYPVAFIDRNNQAAFCRRLSF